MSSVPIDFAPIVLSPGFHLGGRFEIKAEIGRGPTAIVYRAIDTADRVEVAVKVLVPRLSFDRELFLKLERDLRVATEIYHPRLVNIRNVEEWNGTLFVAMELVPGRRLVDDVIRRGPVPRGAALKAVYEIALAMRSLAKEHVTHRAAWPRNVLLEPNLEVKLMDFTASRARQILHKENVGADAPYLAPEECDPRLHGDGRADVYNLGVMLYQLLTGKPPFPATLTAEALAKHDRPPFTPVATYSPGTPEWVDRLVTKAISLVPSERYADVDAFLKDLEATASEIQIAEEVEGVIAEIERKRQAREEREAAFKAKPLPPLKLPEPEVVRRARVNAANYTPEQIEKRKRTWIAVGGMFAGGLVLAVLLAMLLRPRGGDRREVKRDDGKEKITSSEKARLAIDGFRDGFPGDDAGHLEDLVKLGESALDQVKDAAVDPDPVVRRHVALALGSIDAASTREELEGLAGDTDADVRSAALGKLTGVTGVTPAVGERALASPSSSEQILGLGLVASGACDVPASAVAPLAKSPDVQVRTAAVSALAKLPGSEVVPRLYEALDDESPRVREEAARELAGFANEEVGRKLLPLLTDPSDDVAGAAAVTLSKCMGPAMRSELGQRALEGVSRGEALYLAAAMVLAGQQDVASALETAVGSSDPSARAHAARVLAVAKDKGSIPALTASLSARRTGPGQYPILVALSALDSEQVSRLLEGLSGTTVEAVRAADALGESGNGRAVSALQAARHKTQEAAVREACDRALARLGTIPDTAADLLMSSNVEGQRMAAEAFGYAGDSTRTERILALRREQRDAELALVFELALGRLSHLPTLGEFGALARSASPFERQRAVDYFGKVGSFRLLSAIAPLFNDDREEVKAGACAAAAQMRASGALPAVRRLLHDGSAVVRQAAAVAAYDLGDELIVDELARRLQDPSAAVRAETCLTLGAMGTPLAVTALVSRLDDNARYAAARRPEKGSAAAKNEHYPTVRDTAVVALEEIVGLDSGYDVFALDESQAIAIDRLKAHITKNGAEIAASELL